MEIQEKAWVYQIPGTQVQDDDLPYVSFVLGLCNEVKSSAISIAQACSWIINNIASSFHIPNTTSHTVIQLCNEYTALHIYT